MKAAGKRYAKAVRQDGPGHSWGGPHIHSYRALISGLVSEGEKIGGQTLKRLSEHSVKIEAEEIEEVGERVHVCRAKDTARSEETRIIVAPTEGEIAKAVKEACRQLGGRVAQGRAPRSYMERELAKLIEEM